MRMEITLMVEVDGTYVPGIRSSPVGDGTWEPGEGGMMVDTCVRLDGHNITHMLDADALNGVEDAWIENYEENP